MLSHKEMFTPIKENSIQRKGFNEERHEEVNFKYSAPISLTIKCLRLLTCCSLNYTHHSDFSLTFGNPDAESLTASFNLSVSEFFLPSD